MVVRGADGRRGLAVVLAVLAVAGAGLIAAIAPIGSAQSPPATTTSTSTTEPTGTETAATTTAETTTAATTTTTPKPRPKPRPRPLPLGGTIGGIHVGGLSPRAALTVVRAAFRAPLVLQAGGHRSMVSPVKLGAVAYAKLAVARARNVPEGAAVPLGVNVHGAAVRKLVAALAKKYTREPLEPKLFLRQLKPY